MLFRVDDWRSLDGPLFFARAVRLAAYQGVIRARVERIVDGGEAPAPTTAAAPARRAPEVSESVWLAQHSDWISHN